MSSPDSLSHTGQGLFQAGVQAIAKLESEIRIAQ